jgi:hypothetical protein
MDQYIEERRQATGFDRPSAAALAYTGGQQQFH